MKSGGTRLERLYRLFKLPVDSASTGGGVISAALILFMTFATTFQVIMRYVFHAPVKWYLETSEVTSVVIVLIAASYTMKNNAHINVDVLVSHLPGKVRTQLSRFSLVVGILYCGLLTWASLTASLDLYQRWVVSIILGIPLFLIMGCVFIGATLFTLQFIVKLIDSYKVRREG